MNSINFARGQQEAMQAIRKKDMVIARATGFGLAGFGVILAVVFGLRIYFTFQVEQIRSASAQAAARLTQLSAFEREYLVYARKVQLLFGLDQLKKAKQDAVDFFYTIVPDENLLTTVQIDAKEQLISFQIQSPDLFSTLNLLRIFRERLKEEDAQLYSIKVTRLSRDDTGAYSLVGTLAYSIDEEKTSASAMKGVEQ